MFGVLEEDTKVFKDLKEEHDSILVAGSSPLALTLLQPPYEWDADIVVGDSQPVGIPTSFGGPTVGIFACKKKHLRRMPGRMIGETEDSEGNTAYCMTLQTREQHIRRERATSNICTNQSLMALASAAYMFVRGGRKLEELAKENYQKAHEVAERINELEGYEAPYFDGIFFNEFTVKVPNEAEEVVKKASEKDVLPGISLNKKDRFEELPSTILTAVTEMNDEEEIDSLIQTLKEVGK
jgi:glycine dehydrogenase subunit 1